VGSPICVAFLFQNFWPPPPPLPTGDVITTAAAATPIEFEVITAEQNCCLETQHLLVSSSLTIAFRQAGIQRLVGDVSTGVFCPMVPEKLRKDIFFHLHNISHPGKLASWWLGVLLDMSGAALPRRPQPGPRTACTASIARFTATPGPSLCTSPSPNGGSLIFTSI
jgi:hypothetical protein